MKKLPPIYKYGIPALLVAGLICYLWFASAGWTYSEGSRAGTVTKFSKKGTVFKTWEGELSMGSVEQGGMREKWEFSVEDGALAPNGKPVVELVQHALDTQKSVKLEYRQQREVQSWKGKTFYFITNVTDVSQ